MEPEEYGFTTSRRKAVRIEIVVVLAAFLLASIMPTPYSFRLFIWDIEASRIIQDLSGAAVLLFIIWMSGDDLASFGITKPNLQSDAFPTVVAVGLTVAYHYGRAALSPGSSFEFYEPYAPHHQWEWGLLLLSLVCSSIFQELFLRGYAITRFREFFGSTPIAVVASAMCFGIWHVSYGGLFVLDSAVFGLIYACVFVAWPRLLPLVIAHTVANVLVYWGY